MSALLADRSALEAKATPFSEPEREPEEGGQEGEGSQDSEGDGSEG